MKQKKERGAIVVEATISLTAFIFAIFTILMIVDVCYTQAKISTALNSATKEISQYCLLYYKLGLNEINEAMQVGTGDARDTATGTIDGVADLMGALSGVSSSWNDGDFDNLISEAEKAGDAASGTVSLWADKLADDPKGLILGMAKLAAHEGIELGKSALGEALAKAFMKKNLCASEGDDPNAFLKSHRVADGLDGLDFQYSTLLYNGEPKVMMVVTYDIEVVRLLGFEFSFTIRQCAITDAWGAGVSGSSNSSSTEASE